MILDLILFSDYSNEVSVTLILIIVTNDIEKERATQYNVIIQNGKSIVEQLQEIRLRRS